mgnify:CR=1 FL=1
MENIKAIKETILKKEKEGYGYKYTELSQINEYLDSIGIRYKHSMGTDEKGDYIITTPIIEGKALEPIRGCRIPEVVLSKNNNPAQEYGAAVTYARRYSLLMAFGLATEDDDAECLTQKKDNLKQIPQVNKIQPTRILKDIPGQNISNKQDDNEIGKVRYLEMKKIAGESNEDILHEALKNEGLSNTKMLGTINEQTYEKVKKQIIDMITMINEAEKEMNGTSEE